MVTISQICYHIGEDLNSILVSSVVNVGKTIVFYILNTNLKRIWKSLLR